MIYSSLFRLIMCVRERNYVIAQPKEGDKDNKKSESGKLKEEKYEMDDFRLTAINLSSDACRGTTDSSKMKVKPKKATGMRRMN
ncbi:hypothetical protein DdX_01747 [Ditylenchus destructor]|uniref:Uncharacterized protein n=1 Tax=Ditylenchus destructor TaxID=166010 RepID=A0AAD4NMD7_9BILA|nr:hypothetical protein DdX_01747 [Ditylenchus destructor]